VARLELRKIKAVSRFELSDQPITVGRSTSSSLVLDDQHVSRRHCVIEVVDGEPRIRDLGSHGGTFVNAQRITEAVLFDGDRVSIGPFDLVFKESKSDLGPKRVRPVPAAAHAPTLNGTAKTEAADLIDRAELLEVQGRHEQDREEDARRIAELESELSLERESRATDRRQLEDLKTQLEVSQAVLNDRRDETKRQEQDQEQERQAVSDKLRDAEANFAAARAETDLLQKTLTARITEIEELNRSMRSLQERIEELEIQRRREIDHLERELFAARDRTEQLKVHEHTLQEQVDVLEKAKRAAVERAEQSGRAMAMMRGQIQSLDDAARRVSALQERLAAIERAWLEVDQQIDDAGEENPAQLQAAALQRHRISAELEMLNQQRDVAVASLRDSAEQLRAMTERQSVHVANLALRSRTTAKSGGRRWWKFGR